MANTRESMGDQATLDSLISHTLATLEEDGITTLRNYALYQNTGLTSVNFPNLTNTGQYAFQNCTSLLSAILPKVTAVGNYTFDGCTALKKLTLGAITSINQYAFQKCKALKYNDLDFSAVKTIGNNVFNESGIGKLILPACTSLGTYTGKGTRMGVIDITNNITMAANRFNTAYGLCHLILRSSTLCSLSATSAFTNTGIANGKGWIYVPTDLVDTYKSATNWSTYASQIVDISEYPKALQDETITDTWAEIATAENDGTYATKYKVGDIKYVDIGGTQVPMQIVAMDSDSLANSSGNAKITWISVGLVETMQMKLTATTTNGWKDCLIRSFLRDVLYDQIDSNVRGMIKEVTKTYKDVTTNSTLSITDTLWIPSSREIFGGTNLENSGAEYTSFFNNATARIKRYGLSSSADFWWLRSAYSSADFRNVTNTGYEGGNNAYNSIGVVLGFCT